MWNKYRNHIFYKIIVLFAFFFSTLSLSETNTPLAKDLVTSVKVLAISDLFEENQDTFLAEIDATNRAQLSFQVKGQLEKLAVRMGQRVKKGQVLATLDPKDLQLALNAVNAEYLLIKAQWERSKSLFSKKLVSANDHDKIEAQYKTARVNLQRAQTDLSYTTIRAPFDGVVAFTYAKPYQFVKAQQKVLNLINNEKLDVLVTLPVSYVESYTLPSLSKAAIQVVMDNDPDFSLPATFKEISTEPNSETNSFAAVVSIDRPANKNYLSGMTGLIQIEKKQFSQQIVLPSSAWISKNSHQGQVWLMDPDTNTVSKATLKLNEKGAVESGLSMDSLVVIAGVERLSENQEVKAWIREEGI